MPTSFHVLPWYRPLPEQAARWLARGWGGGTLDLRRLLVVVPTRQSGRRLREALAVLAADRGAAVFPPLVVPPEYLVTCGLPEGRTATRLEALLAWCTVLLGADLTALRNLFPVDPPQRTFAWALRLAVQFNRLKRELGEAGLRFADVPVKAGEDFPEAARWIELAGLERSYLEKLGERGLLDAQEARLAWVEAPQLPPDIGRIIVLAAPDPLPLAVRVLEKFAGQIPVEVVVFGPEHEARALFDDWGRPREEAWLARALELPRFEQDVHLCPDPAAQAERLVAAVRNYAVPEGWLALGVIDPEIMPLIEGGLARAGVPGFNPEGRLLVREGLYRLLEHLAAVLRGGAFDEAAALLRCPEVFSWLRHCHGEKTPFDLARLLAGADALRARHLPPTLAEARRHAEAMAADYPELGPALTAVDELAVRLRSGVFPENAAAVLTGLFGERMISGESEEDRALAAAAELVADMLRQTARVAGKFPGLAPSDWWDLLLSLAAEERIDTDKPAGALELQGWLELLWEDAPHLLVAGLNDGLVPGAVTGDPFLPESLRRRLGLKTNEARLARDTYLLQAIAKARATDGRIELLLGKTTGAGDPLRPSRLLLRCADGELPARVAFLFREVVSVRPGIPWRRAWKLRPAGRREMRSLSVTAFRDYLACPFRFYLGHVLRMESVDPGRMEMDGAGFGEVCHAALEALGREAALRDCTDAARLKVFLEEKLAAVMTARFGSLLSLPLTLQFESARQRLAKAAEALARARAEGWVLEQVEWKFPAEPGFVLGGLSIRGKIDRLERHEATGALRVLDYKTGDTPLAPAEAHFRALRRSDRLETLPEFARFASDGRTYVWTDLQLPLYCWALRDRGEVACGYFNLPKAVGETSIALWGDLTPELQAEAQRCAEGVVEAVRTRRFWPPAERINNDDFAALFHEGAAASIDESFFQEALSP